MGVGTTELVPFWKIAEIRIEETTRGTRQRGEMQDLAQFEIVLVKVSGKRLEVGDIIVARSMVREGLDDVREVADAIAEMTGKPLIAPEVVRRPQARRRGSPTRSACERSATPRDRGGDAAGGPTPRPFALDRPARVQRRGAPAGQPRARDRVPRAAAVRRRRSSSPMTAAATARRDIVRDRAAAGLPPNVAAAARAARDATQGKGAAIRTGVPRRARAATSSSWTPTSRRRRRTRCKLLERLEAGAPVVIGSRIQPDGSDMRASQPAQRRIVGRLFTMMRKTMRVLPDIDDTQCPMKGFQHDVAQAVFQRQRLERLDLRRRGAVHRAHARLPHRVGARDLAPRRWLAPARAPAAGVGGRRATSSSCASSIATGTQIPGPTPEGPPGAHTATPSPTLLTFSCLSTVRRPDFSFDFLP